MKRGTVLSLLLGAILGVIPGTGAIAAQAPELLDSRIECDLWEPIPDWRDQAESIIRTRHEDVKTAWWEIDGEIPDNPDIPDDVELWATVYGVEYNISPELLCAIAWKESRFTADAKNGQYTGVMQVGTKVHKARIEALGYEVEDMTEIRSCIHVAADYLAELFQDQDDPAVVLLKYNGNTAGLANYYKTGHIAPYARKILELAALYEEAVGK